MFTKCRNSLPRYVDASPADLHNDQTKFFAIITEIEGFGLVPRTDAIDRFARDYTLEELVTAIERDIGANKPAAALDRLHTYCIKKFAHLLKEKGISFRKEDPLQSRAGLYIKALENEQAVRPITLRIMKSAISIFDSYNSIRNNKSFAHDNEIIEPHEARFIFDSITSILRFLKAKDVNRFGA